MKAKAHQSRGGVHADPPSCHTPAHTLSMADAVRVAVRARPLLSHELETGACSIASKLSKTDLILGSDRVFSYNHVFGEDDEQEYIFDEAVRGLQHLCQRQAPWAVTQGRQCWGSWHPSQGRRRCCPPYTEPHAWSALAARFAPGSRAAVSSVAEVEPRGSSLHRPRSAHRSSRCWRSS